MSGIYIHIPFCKQKCSYCDFHFSTNKRLETEMVGAICQEIIKKKDKLINNTIETVYFGGGSPSFIETENIGKIIQELQNHFEIEKNVEITIECNPDDITEEFLVKIIEYGVNRISLGIQSFFDDDLKLLNRAHDSTSASDSIQLIKNAGIQNITIDLIYGLPNMTMDRWQQNIQKALDLDVPHISSYCLTIEEKTLLHHQVSKGIIQVPKDEEQFDQYSYLVVRLTKEGYDNYEISNFAKEGSISKHNSSYWKNKNYLGFGPSAHSKIGNVRFWNISNNNQFIKRLETDNKFDEEEILTQQDLFNELIMIGLRTKWGVEIAQLATFPFYDKDFQELLNKLESEDKIFQENDRIFITQKNKFIADTIISELFVV